MGKHPPFSFILLLLYCHFTRKTSKEEEADVTKPHIPKYLDVERIIAFNINPSQRVTGLWLIVSSIIKYRALQI